MWFFKRLDAPDDGVPFPQNPDFWIFPGHHTLGRAVGGDAIVRIHSPSVSRRHGVITCEIPASNDLHERPTLQFEDKNSTYGTSIGSEEFRGSVRFLREGDVIQFGQKALFRVEWHSVVLYAARPQQYLQELASRIGVNFGEISLLGLPIMREAITPHPPRGKPHRPFFAIISCTHLVKNDGDHFDVLACAAALAGVPIIRQTWAQAILERGSPHDALPDPRKYLPNLAINVKEPEHLSWLLLAERKTIFAGFVFTISSPMVQADHLEVMLRSAGGQVADLVAQVGFEGRKAVVIVHNDASPGRADLQRTTVTRLLNAVLLGSIDDLLLPALQPSSDVRSNLPQSAAEVNPSGRVPKEAVILKPSLNSEVPSKKRMRSAAAERQSQSLTSSGYMAALTSAAGLGQTENDRAPLASHHLGSEAARMGLCTIQQSELLAGSCQAGPSLDSGSLGSKLPMPATATRIYNCDTSAKGSQSPEKHAAAANLDYPGPADLGTSCEDRQDLKLERNDLHVESIGRQMAVDDFERKGERRPSALGVVEQQSERDVVAPTVITSTLIVPRQRQRQLSCTPNCGHLPDFKVFRKQLYNRVEHIAKPVLAYARGVYSGRAVDADEFLRRQQEREKMDRTADDLFKTNIRAVKPRGSNHILGHGAFSFRR